MSDVMRQKYRELSEPEKKALDDLKRKAAELYDLVDWSVPAGREQSLAKTKIEEAVMWAVKGITA